MLVLRWWALVSVSREVLEREMMEGVVGGGREDRAGLECNQKLDPELPCLLSWQNSAPIAASGDCFEHIKSTGTPSTAAGAPQLRSTPLIAMVPTWVAEAMALTPTVCCLCLLITSG